MNSYRVHSHIRGKPHQKSSRIMEGKTVESVWNKAASLYRGSTVDKVVRIKGK